MGGFDECRAKVARCGPRVLPKCENAQYSVPKSNGVALLMLARTLCRKPSMSSGTKITMSVDTRINI